MTTVRLIRHARYPLLGRAIGGRAAHALDAGGQAEAAALAGRLAARPIAAVLASPVARAQQTAAPIAARHGIGVTAEPGVSEIDFGEWEGASFAALEGDPRWHAWNARRSLAGTPGGETMLAAQARAVDAVMRAEAAWRGSEIAIVSHADIIKAILLHLLGAPLDMLHRLEIAPASESLVVFAGGAAVVRAINLPP